MRKTVGGEPIFSPILYYSSRRSLASLSLLPRSFYREAPSTPSFPPPRSIAKAPHAKGREAAGDKLEPNQPTLKESPPSNRRSAGGETTPPLKARKQAIPCSRKGKEHDQRCSEVILNMRTALHFGGGTSEKDGPATTEGGFRGSFAFTRGGPRTNPPVRVSVEESRDGGEKLTTNRDDINRRSEN